MEECILLSEKANQKVYILCDSNYMTFWKKQNYGDSKKMSGCQVVERREGRIENRGILEPLKQFCTILR